MKQKQPFEQARSGRCGAVNQDGEPCVCSRWRGHAPPHRGPVPGEFYNGERYEWGHNEKQQDQLKLVEPQP